MTAASDKAGEFGYPGLSRYVNALERWYRPELQRAYDGAILPDGTWRLCFGLIVYGGYVDRFVNVCLPSLLAPDNIDALNDPLIIVHTDERSVSRIAAALRQLRSARVEIHVIPQAIIDMVPENAANKYWLLGTAHNLHMQQAKYCGHAYHMLMPDHVYANGYFKNLARLARDGKRAIVQGALSAVLENVAGRLGRPITPERLTALALDHLHPQVMPFVMNRRDDFPPSLLLIMAGERAVHIISPHMSIVYLSHEVLMRAPSRIPSTIDGQLPFFIPDDVEPYVPMPNDGMVYIEVSDLDKAGCWDGGCTLSEFCARFWIATYCCRGFERFFGLTTELGLPAGYRHSMVALSDEKIAAIKRDVRQAVFASYQEVYDALPERHRIDPLLWAQQRQEAA
jgi:hypothetical protein